MPLVAIIYVNKVNLVMDVAPEIKFKTARSSGKGGQNVNKVETMVEGYWSIDGSLLADEEQKKLLREKLANRITAQGYLLVKSQTERTQLGNKHRVTAKMNLMILKALYVPKKRKPTKPNRATKEKRIELKKKLGEVKLTRMKIKP